MKRSTGVILLLIMICLAAILGGCGSEPVGEVLYEESVSTIEGMVAESDCAVVGTYHSIESYIDYVYYEFTVEEVLYGQYSDEDLYVYELRTDSNMSTRYKKGQSYILILRNGEQSKTDEHTHYVTLGSVDFPENGPYYFYGEEVTPPDSQDMKEYLCALAAQYAA